LTALADNLDSNLLGEKARIGQVLS
jgi:hypothetical protein